MSEQVNFDLTPRQYEAIDLLSSKAKDVMLFGGSRSGKTFLAVYAIIVRACKVKSRHCILRSKFNHAKRSIWLDTLPKVISIAFPEMGITEKDYNKSDYFLKLPNNSEIWVGGLDDKERVEKILGNEYSTLYFNECSQIAFESIQLAKTRLAEKNILKKKAYYDENPPRRSHWSYWQFIKKLNPADSEPLKKPENYASLLMNPEDNQQNIDEEYLELLESLPEKERARFLKGEFTDDSDGVAYYEFDRELHTDKEIKKNHGQILIGMDFNVDPMTAIVGQYINNNFHIIDEIYLKNSDTFQMASTLTKMGYQGTVYPDSTGKNRKTSGKSDFSILKDNGFQVKSVHNPLQVDRVNNVNRLFKDGRIIISPKCKKLINDLEKVVWKDNKLDQKTDKMLTHISDCLGYLTWNIEPLTSYKGKGTTTQWR